MKIKVAAKAANKVKVKSSCVVVAIKLRVTVKVEIKFDDAAQLTSQKEVHITLHTNQLELTCKLKVKV